MKIINYRKIEFNSRVVYITQAAENTHPPTTQKEHKNGNKILLYF